MEEQKSKKKFWTKEKLMVATGIVCGVSIGVGIYCVGRVNGYNEHKTLMNNGLANVFTANPGFEKMMDTALSDPGNWKMSREEC